MNTSPVCFTLLFGFWFLASAQVVFAQGIEGGSYCSDGDGLPEKVTVEYAGPPTEDNEFMDLRVNIDTVEAPAMSSFSYFGRTLPPNGFVVAVIPSIAEVPDAPEILLFEDTDTGKWLTYNGKTMRACE
ncbi:hypothetical protein JM93_04294 [Roseibium hamelinense]|uniref:Uncharacterized protein n=1 Tax=Roseibium hamelinense TaxID=150831 RepID=A0A562SEZ7_9HYPH|nr:hypothetical protein [Roseibium hamelinense]MTI42134.1 hypothetical protein [Roseibium hamelinense]TWI79945.1 hypothetical protein JM93_04294 [Roseibium hamelinense]